MANPDYARLKGVDTIHKGLLTENLLYGVIDFFTWGVLQVGGFQNITRTPATSGVYGGNRCRLRPVSDPRYTDGRVWEGFRGDWVWETGIDFSVQPIRPTGVWINGNFTAFSGNNIDYTRGRVVLDTAISPRSVVETEYSTRWATFLDARSDWPRQLITEPYRIDRNDFLSATSGAWQELPDTRAQLPLVAVEIGSNRSSASFAPYQLGGGQWAHKRVLFHIFGENPTDVSQLADIISYQNNRNIRLINRGLLKESAYYPPALDFRGMLVTSPMQYPQLTETTANSGYCWTNAYISQTFTREIGNVNGWLHYSIVEAVYTVILENI